MNKKFKLVHTERAYFFAVFLRFSDRLLQQKEKRCSLQLETDGLRQRQ